jgi:hypothetical protein
MRIDTADYETCGTNILILSSVSYSLQVDFYSLILSPSKHSHVQRKQALLNKSTHRELGIGSKHAISRTKSG